MRRNEVSVGSCTVPDLVMVHRNGKVSQHSVLHQALMMV